MKPSRGKIKAFSFAMIALVLISGYIAGMLREKNEKFDIGDYSGITREEAVSRYEADPTDEELAGLVRVLCWQYMSAGDESAAEPLLRYGTLLKDHAKEGACDLEKLDDADGTLLKVLSVIGGLEAK